MDLLIDLDRRFARAVSQGRGIKLSAELVDAMVQNTTIVQQLGELKAQLLKEQAECRAQARQRINGVDSGSTNFASRTGALEALITTSSGTNLRHRDAAAAVLRARRT
jgi:hypothetical protein